MRFHRAGLFALLLALLMITATAPVQAAGLDEALAHFTEGDFTETEAGINAVVESGDDRAAIIIEALQDGRLFFSPEQKKVLYKNADGMLFDAATGNPVAGAGPTDLETVEINNRLRRVMDAAIGGLTLMASDPAKRLDAARAVFKSHETNVLPAVEAALAKETNGRISRVLTEAHAAIVLYDDDAGEADKLAAIGVIRARGDQESVALLSGLPSETPGPVAGAAARAVTAAVAAAPFPWSRLKHFSA